MAYLKNWTDNFFKICFMGTSWVAVSINNITTRASREMTSRQNIKMFDVNGVNVANHWHVAGEVFAISDCLVLYVRSFLYIHNIHVHSHIGRACGRFCQYESSYIFMVALKVKNQPIVNYTFYKNYIP